MHAAPSYAGFWQRFAGSGIDWALCLFAPVLASSFALAAIIGEGDDGLGWVGALWIVFVVACFLGYLTYFLSRGQSPGMKAVGIQVVNARTGRPPGAGRALVRSFLALIVAASVFVLLAAGFSDQPEEGLSSTDLVIIYFMAFLLIAGVLGHLWMIWDPKKQTLPDKLCGVVVVGKFAPAGLSESG